MPFQAEWHFLFGKYTTKLPVGKMEIPLIQYHCS